MAAPDEEQLQDSGATAADPTNTPTVGGKSIKVQIPTHDGTREGWPYFKSNLWGYLKLFDMELVIDLKHKPDTYPETADEEAKNQLAGTFIVAACKSKTSVDLLNSLHSRGLKGGRASWRELEAEWGLHGTHDKGLINKRWHNLKYEAGMHHTEFFKKFDAKVAALESLGQTVTEDDKHTVLHNAFLDCSEFSDTVKTNMAEKRGYQDLRDKIILEYRRQHAYDEGSTAPTSAASALPATKEGKSTKNTKDKKQHESNHFKSKGKGGKGRGSKGKGGKSGKGKGKGKAGSGKGSSSYGKDHQNTGGDFRSPRYYDWNTSDRWDQRDQHSNEYSNNHWQKGSGKGSQWSRPSLHYGEYYEDHDDDWYNGYDELQSFLALHVPEPTSDNTAAVTIDQDTEEDIPDLVLASDSDNDSDHDTDEVYKRCTNSDHDTDDNDNDRFQGSIPRDESFVGFLETPTMMHAHAAGLADSNKYLVDNGCNVHVCNNKSAYCTNLRHQAGTLKGIGEADIIGVGDVRFECTDSAGATVTTQVADMVCVPSSPYSILSVSKLQSQGCKIDLESNTIQTANGRVIPMEKKSGLWFLPTRPTSADAQAPSVVMAANVQGRAMPAAPQSSNKMLMHHRLGHVSEQTLKYMTKYNMVDGMESIKDTDDSMGFCDSCPFGKAHRSPSSRHKHLPGVDDDGNEDVIFVDINGPTQHVSITGKRWTLGFVHAKTRTAKVYAMRTKAEALRYTEVYIKWFLRRHKLKRLSTLITLHSDNDSVFTSGEYRAMCRSNDVQQRFTPPYIHRHNGVIENFWRTLMSRAKCMLHYSGQPYNLWPFAVLYSSMIHNHVMKSTKDSSGAPVYIIPEEEWTGERANVRKFKIFGCPAYYHVYSEEKDFRKGDDKVRRGIFVGLDDESPSYLIWDPARQKVYKRYDVIFDELWKSEAPRSPTLDYIADTPTSVPVQPPENPSQWVELNDAAPPAPPPMLASPAPPAPAPRVPPTGRPVSRELRAITEDAQRWERLPTTRGRGRPARGGNTNTGNQQGGNAAPVVAEDPAEILNQALGARLEHVLNMM